MTITKTIIGCSTAVGGDVLNHYAPADKSDWVQIDTTVKDDGSREAIYQKVVDVEDVLHAPTVRVGYYPTKTGRASVSVKWTTWVRTVDSVLNTDVFEPITYTIAIAGPGASCGLEVTTQAKAIGNLVSWLLPTLDDSTFVYWDTSAIDLLKFGVVSGLNNLAD